MKINFTVRKVSGKNIDEIKNPEYVSPILNK